MGEALLHFENVSDLRRPLSAVHLDRTNARFQALQAQAQLFLQSLHQSTTGGMLTGQAILFRMNDLFEAWIARTLRRKLLPEGWTIRLQGPFSHALTRGGMPLFRMQPDIVLDRSDLRIVLDTKWKRLDPVNRDPRRGVAQTDVYQLMAYARAYDADAVVLRYPGSESGVSLDRLQIVPDGPLLWLAEVPLVKLEEVPGTLAFMVARIMAPFAVSAKEAR